MACNNVEESKVSSNTHEVEQPESTMQEAQRVTSTKESQSYSRTHNYIHKQKEDRTSNSHVMSIVKVHNKEQPKGATQEAQRMTKKNESQNHESVPKSTHEQKEDKSSNGQVALIIKAQKLEQPKRVMQETQRATIKKEEGQNHPCIHNDAHKQKENISISQKENLFSKTQQCQEPREPSGSLQNQHNDGELEQKSSNCEEKVLPVKRTQEIQETNPQNKELEQAHDHPKERRHSSSTLIVSLNTTASQPQNKTNTSSDGSQSKFKTQVFVSSVKIPRRSDSGIISPVPEVIEEESSTKTVKSEVFVPAVSSSSPDSKHDSLSSPQSSSTSFVRLGRLTSSVRAKFQSEDQDDHEFTRSSSVRLSLRSRKIENRMEKYTSAIQKSASVRIPASPYRAGIGASDGIANKRSAFEREETSKANISQKDLTLPGSVTSRISQWSNKAQQNPSSVTGAKDFRTGDVATKRMLWQQRSQSSSDTKL